MSKSKQSDSDTTMKSKRANEQLRDWNGNFASPTSMRGRAARLYHFVATALRPSARPSTKTGQATPALMVRLFGNDYEGALSDYDEWHAAEYGALLGFTAVMLVIAPGVAPAVAGALGLSGSQRLLSGELKRQIQAELHYLGGAAVVVFLAGLALVALVQRTGLLGVIA